MNVRGARWWPRIWPRIWPDTMAGQLIGLLFCGLFGAHLIALFLSPKGGGEIHTISRRQVLDNIVVAYRLAQSADADTALAAFDGDAARFRRTPAAPSIPAAAEGRGRGGLRAALQRRLDLPPDAVLVGWRTAPDGARELLTGLRLPDGRWLGGVQRPVIDRQWWRPLRFSIPVSLLPVLVGGILFVRRFVRPMRALARAADRVSRGEYGPPLPVTGPREAREVTASFNIMQARLARYLDDQRRMLGSISHDLRSLVTSLRLRAELVDDDDLRAAMQRTLREMAAMIEETLRFARDDATHEATAEVDLARLLRDVAGDQAAQGRDVALAEPDAAPLACRCRPLALKRALHNLLDNAVRYGGGARIRFMRARHAGGHALLRIAIEDDGPGIAPDQLERVFEPFYRLEQARHPELGGVGLGLAIARSCVEAHGGSLTLENRAGGGLRALVTLPA